MKALHGLRFLAAFSILLSHSCAWLANFNSQNTVINLLGNAISVYGMPLFFVLSGFVIHYSYSRLFSTMRPGWAIVEFLGARFARIYPLFICFLLVGIAVDAVLLWFHGYKLNLLLVLAHSLTLTESWVYIVLFGDKLLIDGPFGLSWSLATEFFFYLAYIVLVPHVTRLKPISTLLITAGATSAGAIAAMAFAAGHQEQIIAFARQYMGDHFEQSDHSAIHWFFYYSPYVRMLEFILGCLTAQLYARFSERKVSPREARLGSHVAAGSMVILLALAFIDVARPFGPLVAEYVDFLILNFGLAVPIAVLIFCVSRYRSCAVAAMLSAPLMVLLGDLSFSIYAVHTWTLRIFERPTMEFSIGVELESVLRIALAIALTVILSAATYRLIEVPARARVRKVVGRRLVRTFGPREANMIPAGQAYCSRCTFALRISFVAMMGALLAYQFLLVPHFAAYTR